MLLCIRGARAALLALLVVTHGCRNHGVQSELTKDNSRASALPPAQASARLMVPVVRAALTAIEPASQTATTRTLLVLHGYGSTGAGHLTFFGLPNAQTIAAGARILAPNGVLDRVNHAQFWNAVPSCCDFEHVGVDDVGYLQRLLPAPSSGSQPTGGIIGHSNGGAMALRLACERADQVARVAVLAPAFFGDSSACRPSRPVGVLIVHGERDRVVPYAGGPLKRIHPQANATQSIGAQAIAAHFAAINGCTGSTVSAPEDFDTAADRDGDPREAAHTHYEGCKAPVELYSLANVGHALLRQSVHYTATMTNFALGATN
jgi:polyhydroxybutyrate depolymerase